jgi:hypothetical protein
MNIDQLAASTGDSGSDDALFGGPAGSLFRHSGTAVASDEQASPFQPEH